MKSTNKLIIFVFAFLALAASVYAQSPHEELQQMVEQLQKTPTDTALREKIIKLAQDVKPAPVVPPEAKRAFVMGGTYQKEAKSPEDFGLAVKAFQDASTAAPWWGDAYYNLSVALESAKRYDEAKSALTLYLLTKPKDAEQAQERLYAIDAKKDLAARAAASAASAARAAEERKKSSIEGAVFSYSYTDVEVKYRISNGRAARSDRRLASGGPLCGSGAHMSGPIGEKMTCPDSYGTTIPLVGRRGEISTMFGPKTIEIAEDGQTLLMKEHNGNEVYDRLFKRQ